MGNQKNSLLFAEVWLPLALGGRFTYLLPRRLEQKVQVGSRVLVSFGVKKRYTAFVIRIHNTPPAGDWKLKEIEESVDEIPLILPLQIAFWEWMASYYLCYEGEVCRAALPAGLKMESESVVEINPDYDRCVSLTAGQEAIMAALSDEKTHSIKDLQRTLEIKNALPALLQLYEKGAVRMKEALNDAPKPRQQKYVSLSKSYFNIEALATLYSELKRSKRQQQLLDAYIRLSGLEETIKDPFSTTPPAIRREDLLKVSDASIGALKALCDKQVLEISTETPHAKDTERESDPLTLKALNTEQEDALAKILSSWKQKSVCLLHGVTSSGKTEIYLHLIKKEIAAGRQVLYLLPEIALTTQIMQRFRVSFGENMGVYHSQCSDAQRVSLWKRQLSPHPYPVILGARSALFLPFKDLGLVIVDEEHEPSYKQQDPAPRYHARDAAIMLATMSGARVLLGTATPSLESYAHAHNGKYALVRMLSRYGEVEMPEIHIQDTRELRRKKEMLASFSPELIDEMRQAFQKGEQVILFKNRRGYAPRLECADCGWTPKCRHCDVALTYHKAVNKLMCHYCGRSYHVPERCPECGGIHLGDQGCGTEKIEEEIQALFPNVKTARLDLDTTRKKSAFEKILSDFAQGRTDVLIGTQMLSKGLDFDKVHVVGVVSADAMLNQPDFRSHERAFQMLTQVAGRAGRRNHRGLVILQTMQPTVPVIQQVQDGNYLAFFDAQMTEREAFVFPPFCRLIDIYTKDRDATEALHAAEAIATLLRTSFGGEVLGPYPPRIGRMQSFYFQKVTAKIPLSLSPSHVRQQIGPALEKVRRESRAMIYCDVDPL